MNLLESRDVFRKNMEFSIKSPKAGHCFIRIYPSTGERFSSFAMVAASGRRFMPHGIRIAVIGGVIILVILFLVISNVIDGSKYSIRRRRI